MADKKTHLAVIGGGPGGYAAAFLAADLGLEVSLIDPAINPGGVCLYRGCIPSKALLHAAKVIDEAHEAKAWGLNFSGLKIKHARLREWKNEVVARLTGGLGQLVKQRKINYIQAAAEFQDKRTLLLKAVDGGQSSLAFEYAIIATGSDATRIPQFELDSDHLLDATTALEQLQAAIALDTQTRGMLSENPVCLLCGGETTVTLRGKGRGGRNQELALAAALALDRIPKGERIVLVALATDGTDDEYDVLVVAYGTVARVCSTAIEELREEGLKTALVRPITLWPFPYRAVREAAEKAKAVLVVELSAGQMIEDVQLALAGSRPIHFFNRMGGILVSPDEVVSKVKAIRDGASEEVRHG